MKREIRNVIHPEQPWTREEALHKLRNMNGEVNKIEEWNNYRKNNPNWRPYLSDENHYEDLRAVKLCYKNEQEVWRGIDLSGSMLFGADFSNADLHNVNFMDSNLSHAILNDTELKYANLTNANLRDAHLQRTSLYKTKIIGSDLRGADLREAHIFSIIYNRKEMNGRYLGVRGLESCYGDAFFKRDAQDQDFIDTVEKHWTRGWKKVLFKMWKVIDFGRSITRVAIIAFLSSIIFGVIYWLDWFYSLGLLNYSNSANSWLTPLYYSIVTFTTLGFGDVTPTHWIGEMIVILEVISGYITLGLILAIIASTVSRRS